MELPYLSPTSSLVTSTTPPLAAVVEGAVSWPNGRRRGGEGGEAMKNGPEAEEGNDPQRHADEKERS